MLSVVRNNRRALSIWVGGQRCVGGRATWTGVLRRPIPEYANGPVKIVN